MLKRVTWFTVGTAAGVVGTVVAYLRARDLARRHLPENVADAAVRVAELADSGVRVAVDRGTDLLCEVRSSMTAKKQTRKQAEVVLRQQLERAGL
ncbi:MAG: hypothetical protein WEA11_00585 [Acidimicrobiales bacterium]